MEYSGDRVTTSSGQPAVGRTFSPSLMRQELTYSDTSTQLDQPCMLVHASVHMEPWGVARTCCVETIRMSAVSLGICGVTR